MYALIYQRQTSNHMSPISSIFKPVVVILISYKLVLEHIVHLLLLIGSRWPAILPTVKLLPPALITGGLSVAGRRLLFVPQLRLLHGLMRLVLFWHVEVSASIGLNLLLITLHLLLVILSKLLDKILCLLQVGFKLLNLHWSLLLVSDVVVELWDSIALLCLSTIPLLVYALRMLITSAYANIIPSSQIAMSSILCSGNLIAVILTLTWSHVEHRTQLLLTTLCNIGMLGRPNVVIVLRSRVLFLIPA